MQIPDWIISRRAGYNVGSLVSAGVEESRAQRPSGGALSVAVHQPQSPSARGARVATSIHRQISESLGVREQQVEAAVALLDGGATVPFIARYRKEATGTLDDAQLRTLAERLNYLRKLEERRAVILNSIREQGKLDAALKTAILTADSPP
jgi:hypothetical protein